MKEVNQTIDETQKRSSRDQFEAYIPNFRTDSFYTPATDLILRENFTAGLHATYYLTVADLDSTGVFCLECFEESEGDYEFDQFAAHDIRFYRQSFTSLTAALLAGRELILSQQHSSEGI